MQEIREGTLSGLSASYNINAESFGILNNSHKSKDNIQKSK